MEWKVESRIETARGNDCMVIRSEQGRYKYSRIRALSNGETRYRCTNRRCNVNVFVNGSDHVVRASSLSHSHPPLKPAQYTLVKLRTACKQFARENIANKPLDQVIKEAYDIGAYSLPQSKKRLLKKAIHTAKRHVIAQAMKMNDKLLVNNDKRKTNDENGVVMQLSRDRSPLIEDVSEGPSLVCVLPNVEVKEEVPSLLSDIPELELSGREVRVKSEEENFGEPSPPSFYIKEEAEDDDDSVLGQEVQDLFQDQSTQTEVDQDLAFLHSLHPLLKRLTPAEKSTVQSQIRQLFMWKLNKAI